MEHKKIKNKGEIAYALTLLTQIGWSFVVTIGMCFFIGKFIDDKLGTTPWIMFVFIVIGVMAAFKNLFLLVERTWKD